ncbi:uncharacterized protein [Clytia hemisphaerica]|uniref:uncharacterized protein n=1 Tax=Clytia hemisphaerica TaxID=252671 RepID=UPI0034D3CA9C
MVAFPCGVCYNPVATTHRGIYCNNCRFWIHAKCNNTSPSDYQKLLDSNPDDTWLCQKCLKKEAVFDSLTDEGLKLTLQETEMGQDIHCPYLSLSEQNKKAEKLSKNSLSTFHMNIASLELHKQNLINIISNRVNPFQIIGITETGFKDKEKAENAAKIQGYNHYDCCTDSNKGGARLYFSKEYETNPRDDLKIYKRNEVESIIHEVILDNHPSIIVACIYKHPNMDIDEFNILYSNLLDKINSDNKQAILMGDFNIDLLKADLKPSHKDFLETNLSRFFTPQITRPTRITPYSKTLIDNIFTNILSFESNSHNLICGISDHLPQILNLDISANKRTKTKKSWRDFSKFDREDFLLDFISISWPDHFENKTSNQKLETFINLTNNLVDQHAPIKTKFINDFISPKPWVTFGLRQAMLNRDKYHGEYLKLKDDSPEKIPKFARYKRHRNFIIKLLRISKNKYIKEYFFRHKTNLSLIWKTINEITNTKTKDSSSPKLLIHNNAHITKEEDIAELFNDFYGSIAEKTKAKIPQTNKIFTDFMGNPTNASIHLTPTTPMAVYKLIEKIDLKKVSGPNSIDPKILKMTSITASEIISYIFNECLDKDDTSLVFTEKSLKELNRIVLLLKSV